MNGLPTRSILLRTAGCVRGKRRKKVVHMFRGTPRQDDAESVPLKSAFLCVDCESVSNTHSDECPICGSHSLLSLAGMMGGTLLDYKATRVEKQKLLLFDVEIRIEMKHMEGREVSAAIESISSVVGEKLGRSRALIHINVDPVPASGTLGELKAA